MTNYKFKGILQNGEWIMPAFVKLDKDGKLISITKKKDPKISYTKVNGFALAGMQNAHSHAFQYAMVGLTENHSLGKLRDDFWAWRTAMYQLALSVNPDQIEAIAAMLYLEMLKHGYTEVAEFHYVHHDKNGKSYQNKSELGERLIAAAKQVGIKITLIPIFYQMGGFGKSAGEGQRRFISKNIKKYQALLAASKKSVRHYKGATLAHGVHSMRAVEPGIIKELVDELDGKTPFHMHVAEQKKEVAESVAYLGARPVEWLLDNINLNENYHLVHATHLTKKETIGLAKSKAKVVLCPTTEGNLGDGLFPLKTFQKAGGNWSIGTDSHIGINPFEELRLLDYGQRLITHQRNIFNDENQGNSGIYSLEKMTANGRKAMGKKASAYFKKGQPFDALVLDAAVPILGICSKENLTSTIVYASNVSMHLGTIVNGKWVVENGFHAKEVRVKKRFVKTLKELKSR